MGLRVDLDGDRRMYDAMVPDFVHDVALMPVDPDVAMENRQTRSRVRRADTRGHVFIADFQPSRHASAIMDIHRSMPERQGRPMAEHYLTERNWPRVGAPVDPRHHTYWYGVFCYGTLTAYCAWHRAGELLQTSSWIGHGDWLNDGVMYLMWVESLAAQRDLGGYAMYHRWSNGSDGLRTWKHNVGLRPHDVEWVL